MTEPRSITAGHAPSPAETFYWSVVEIPWVAGDKATRRRASGGFAAQFLPPGLAEQVALDMPVPMSELHAVSVLIEPKASAVQDESTSAIMLVCAARRETLEAIGEEGGGDPAWFGPATVPESLWPGHEACPGIDAARLNLLVGEFEPRPRRRARLRRHAIAAFCVLACAALLSIGLLRRAARDERRASAAHAAIASSCSPPSDQPRSSRALAAGIESERDRLRAVAGLAQRVRPIRDVGDDLAMLIRAWPSTRPDGRSILTARPLSIAVDPTRAHMSVIIENDGAEGAENGHTGASAFLDSFKVPPGWQLAEPTVSRLGSAGVGGGSGEGDRGERVRVQMVLTLPPASAVTTDPSVGRKP